MPRYEREEKAKIKFRFVEFDMEGGSAALHESLRAIAGAINRGAKPSALPTPKNGMPALPSGEPQETDEAQLEEADIDESVSESEEAHAETGARSNGAPRKFRSPKIVPIDLRNPAPSFDDFCESRKPEGDNKKYLAAVAYLRDHRSIPEVTTDHVFTCYRHMGWNVPRDSAAPLRNLKLTGWVEKGKGKSTYALTHVGENVILKMGK